MCIYVFLQYFNSQMYGKLATATISILNKKLPLIKIWYSVCCVILLISSKIRKRNIVF